MLDKAGSEIVFCNKCKRFEHYLYNNAKRILISRETSETEVTPKRAIRECELFFSKNFPQFNNFQEGRAYERVM